MNGTFLIPGKDSRRDMNTVALCLSATQRVCGCSEELNRALTGTAFRFYTPQVITVVSYEFVFM